ncbi:MAG: hypothetical protein ACU84H_13385 [Gammaproteobacteria bacterium]
MNKEKQKGLKRGCAGKDASFLSIHTANMPLAILSLLLFAFALTPSAYAHRGSGDETDPCRIKVGDEWMHFTAYTPATTGNKSFCRAIPDIGMTNLVFDYEGKQLRKVSIEFEVTKEPEGKRVFYRPPDKSKSGSVDGVVDFRQFGKGNYQAHVTIVDNDKKLDTHIPFSVGIEDESYSGIKKFLFTFIVCAVIIYLSIKFSRGKEARA